MDMNIDMKDLLAKLKGGQKKDARAAYSLRGVRVFVRRRHRQFFKCADLPFAARAGF